MTYIEELAAVILAAVILAALLIFCIYDGIEKISAALRHIGKACITNRGFA